MAPGRAATLLKESAGRFPALHRFLNACCDAFCRILHSGFSGLTVLPLEFSINMRALAETASRQSLDIVPAAGKGIINDLD